MLALIPNINRNDATSWACCYVLDLQQTQVFVSARLPVQMWKHYRLSALLRARREHYRVHTFRNPQLWLISAVYFLARLRHRRVLQVPRIIFRHFTPSLLYTPWQSILLSWYFYLLDVIKISNYKNFFSNICNYLMYINYNEYKSFTLKKEMFNFILKYFILFSIF